MRMFDNWQLAKFRIQMEQAIRAATIDRRFRRGTPRRLRKGKDRSLGPTRSSFEPSTIRMLRRAINKGYVPSAQPDPTRHDWFYRRLAAKS